MPLVVAGDVFDRHNPAPELVNFAIEHMPTCYAVPGQHDLPHHRYDDLHKSAYWTLKEAGIITDLKPGDAIVHRDLSLYGFPWGTPLTALTTASQVGRSSNVHLAVVHHYAWQDGHGHPGASPTDHVATIRQQLAGYTVVVLGDNHSPFLDTPGAARPWLVNPGTFIRRRSDERGHVHGPVVLSADGSVERVGSWPPVEDRWVDEKVVTGLEAVGLDTTELVELLAEVGDQVGSFRDACLRCLKANPRIGQRVQELIVAWLEESRGQ